jgi:hypothetical protein
MHFAVCIDSEEAGDLELRKVYQVLPDELAAQRGYLRIIDESGEDYLYPADWFVKIALPETVIEAFLLAPDQ